MGEYSNQCPLRCVFKEEILKAPEARGEE